jgi:hypothetical protein
MLLNCLHNVCYIGNCFRHHFYISFSDSLATNFHLITVFTKYSFILYHIKLVKFGRCHNSVRQRNDICPSNTNKILYLSTLNTHHMYTTRKQITFIVHYKNTLSIYNKHYLYFVHHRNTLSANLPTLST